MNVQPVQESKMEQVTLLIMIQMVMVYGSDEIIGCTDPLACNYDATPTTDTDNSLCLLAIVVKVVIDRMEQRNSDNDLDDDGVCNADELEGCTDDTACNYDATTTTDTDNSLCLFATGCESCSGTKMEQELDNDADDDGVCDDNEIAGCITLSPVIIMSYN